MAAKGIEAASAENILPLLKEGEILEAVNLEGLQNFTQPPARFTEASLVKELEEKSIGRPSTYAPIVATLNARKYITREKKSLLPTELGFVVTQMMEEYFSEIVDGRHHRARFSGRGRPGGGARHPALLSRSASQGPLSEIGRAHV